MDFDTEEDKLKQQQLYQATELSAQTAAAVKKISRPQNWLLAAAEEYSKKEDWDAALREAYKVFNGNKMNKAQKEYTEVKLVFGYSEESPLEEPLFENLVVNLLVPLLNSAAGKNNATEQE